MNTSKVIKTDWYPERKLVVTQLTGEVNETDIDEWENSLKEALFQIEDNGIFKILVNHNGFAPVNISSHKKFRKIIPLTLADFGWKVGYVNLFEEAKGMKITSLRGITCLVAAHVHQDATKIEKYEALFGQKNERFFTDPKKAEVWIDAVSI